MQTEVTSQPQGPAGPEKKALAEQTLNELLALLELPAKLDIKDASDGGISVAMELAGELPGLQVGRRSHVLEALQFLLNKLVNKPGTERRWVALGVGSHAEPRQPKPQRASMPPQAVGAPSAAPQAAGAPAAPAAPRAQHQVPAPRQERSAPPVRAVEDERSAAPVDDAALSKAVRELAEKSVRLGRFYAVVGLRPEQRALALREIESVDGVSGKAEGEGRSRRVVFVPANPSAMPKRTLPGHDDDEEELD